VPDELKAEYLVELLKQELCSSLQPGVGRFEGKFEPAASAQAALNPCCSLIGHQLVAPPNASQTVPGLYLVDPKTATRPTATRQNQRCDKDLR
jgi:hypothetical protein